MSYTALKTVAGFTSGLATVGYTLIGSSGAVVSARTTTGVFEIATGSGLYAALMTGPTNLTPYVILWDDGQTPIHQACDVLNDPVLSGDPFARLGAPANATIAADIAAVKTDTGTLTSRITGNIAPTTGDPYAQINTLIPHALTFDANNLVKVDIEDVHGTALATGNLPAIVNTYASGQDPGTLTWAAATRTLSTAPPTAAQIAAVILKTPSNLIATDSNGYVTFNNTTLATVTSVTNAVVLPSSAPSWYTAPSNPSDYARNNVAPSWWSSAPTTSQIAASILKTPANLLATDSTGDVTFNNSSIATVTSVTNAVVLPTSAPSWYTAPTNPSDYARNNVAPSWWSSAPTTAQIAASILKMPSNLLATDSNGAVTFNNSAIATVTSVSNPVSVSGSAPSWYTAPANPTDYAKNNVAPSWFTTSPTAASIAALILANPSHLLVTDNNGQVGANNLPSDYVQRSTAPTWWIAPGNNTVYMQTPLRFQSASPSVITQGDNSFSRFGYLTDVNGHPAPLPSGCTVTYSTYLRGQSTPTVNKQPASVYDATLSAVVYNWQTGDTAIAGTYDELWQVTTLDGHVASYPLTGGLVINAFS